MLLCFSVPASAQSDLVFPHLAVGGSPAYETVLQIINEVEADNLITIDVFQGLLAGSANGSPLAVKFEDGTAAATRSLTLAPFQELTTILGSSDGKLANGWVRIRSTLAGGKISGNLIFRQRSGNTIVDSVGAAGQRFRRAIVQIDQREAGSNAGLAFANPEAMPVTVILDLFQGSNRIAAPLPITLQANQHYARLISEIYPSFGNRQGTLIIETAVNRAIPFMALRLDGQQLTSIPVRPLGFAFKYAVTSSGGTIVESGFWLFDMVAFNLIGTGKIETPAAVDLSEVTGSWSGTNFQFRYRRLLGGIPAGMVVFNGTSAGQESTVGADLKSKAITGKVTTIGADGQIISINDFSAFHKFGDPPQ